MSLFSNVWERWRSGDWRDGAPGEAILAVAPKATPPVQTPEHTRPPAPILRPRGRPSYDIGGLGLYNNPFSRIPPTQSFGLYQTIRETIPIVDAAITKTRQLAACPIVDAEDTTKREITAWLNALHVNHIQTGWQNWLGTWLDNAILYGRGHTEILLSATQTDIWGLQELHPKTIFLRPNKDRFTVDVVQNQAFTGQPVTLNPLLMLNAVHDVRGDDPNGTSLLWGLPLVAEIVQKLLKNLGSTWDRFGTPRYHINWQPPDDFADPNGVEADAVLSDLQTDFTTAHTYAIQGDIVDFYTSGKVTVSLIGAEGETLIFEAPMKVLSEQVVTKTHIPPFAFGLSWSVGEIMSQLQANLLQTLIDSLRAQIEAELYYLIDFRQRLTGGDRDFKLIWPKVSLIDIFNASRAQFFQENANQLRFANNKDKWRLGMMSVYDVVRAERCDLEHLTDPEIDRRLPDLVKTPPEDTPPAATGPGRTGTGGGGGLNPGSVTRAMLEDMLNGETVHRAARNGHG